MATQLESTDCWVDDNYSESWKENFMKDGFLVIHNLVNEDFLKQYVEIYQHLFNSKETESHRYDLGAHAGNQKLGSENICQIMWPSLYEKSLKTRPVFLRNLNIVKRIFGDDMEFDFDMMINKFPNSDTPTPWHQDEAYWPDLPDKRAISCWFALDDATVDNGCMWYVKGSHLEEKLRPHQRVKEGSRANFTDTCSEANGEPIPLKRGSCVLHHGRTLHYTRGNTTNTYRRAYIMNFRPKAMIELERNAGFDHGKLGKTNSYLQLSNEISI